MGSKRIAFAAIALVALLGAACSSGRSNGSGGATGSSYKLALISSLTGTASPQFGDTAQGFNAAIGEINAAGGAGGHTLVGKVYDDQTNPAIVIQEVQKAIADGNQMIISVSPLFFLAAKFPKEAGLPVVGGGFDGSEWGTPGYENMFAADMGSNNPENPPTTQIGEFMRDHGGSIACSWGYGISPSSTQSATNAIWSALAAGLKEGVLDTSIPFGGVDFTASALAAKQAKCDSIWSSTDVNSSVALTQALKNADVPVKVNIFAAGLEPTLINGPSWPTILGAYFTTGFRPVSIPNSATATLTASLKKYANRPTNKFPTYNIYEAYVAVQLAAEGLSKAPSTSSAAVIKSLRGITSWNAHGLLANSIDYSTVFGRGADPSCGWYLQAKGSDFVPVSSKVLCGTEIKGKSGKVAP